MLTFGSTRPVGQVTKKFTCPDLNFTRPDQKQIKLFGDIFIEESMLSMSFLRFQDKLGKIVNASINISIQ